MWGLRLRRFGRIVIGGVGGSMFRMEFCFYFVFFKEFYGRGRRGISFCTV